MTSAACSVPRDDRRAGHALDGGAADPARRRGSAPARSAAAARGRQPRRSSRPACARSSIASSPEPAVSDAPDLRHPARRSGRSRCSARPWRRSPPSPSASTRSSSSPTAPCRERCPPTAAFATFAARTKVGRGVRFGHALVAELARRPRPVAVLAHMCPIYAVLAAPLARPLGVRVLLWYAQWHRTRTLDLAARLSTSVVSVDRSTIPIESSRAVGIGHGIDMSLFPCGARHVGRAAVRARRARPLRGVEGPARDRAGGRLARDAGRGRAARLPRHRDRAGRRGDAGGLGRLVDELGLGEAVTLGGPMPRSEVRRCSPRSWALVNNTRSGAPDKVVFEACASCLPVLLSSPPLRPLVDGLGRRCSSRPTTPSSSPRRSSSSPAPIRRRGPRLAEPCGSACMPRTRRTRGPTRSRASRTVSRPS